MRKIISVILALVLTVSLLAGCRNPMEDTQSTTGSTVTGTENAHRSGRIFR